MRVLFAVVPAALLVTGAVACANALPPTTQLRPCLATPPLENYLSAADCLAPNRSTKDEVKAVFGMPAMRQDQNGILQWTYVRVTDSAMPSLAVFGFDARGVLAHFVLLESHPDLESQFDSIFDGSDLKTERVNAADADSVETPNQAIRLFGQPQMRMIGENPASGKGRMEALMYIFQPTTDGFAWFVFAFDDGGRLRDRVTIEFNALSDLGGLLGIDQLLEGPAPSSGTKP